MEARLERATRGQLFSPCVFDARGEGETLVAADGGRCIGILDSFFRPYWIAGQQQIVRETCDWFCLPEYRALGVGLHLMRRMMAKPQPIVVIGGTEFTQNLLPRLKWARLPDVGNRTLGVSARTLSGLIVHKRWQGGIALARAVPNIRLVRRPGRLAPPSANSHVRARSPGDAEALPGIAPYDVAPALDAKVLNWFAGAPAELGQFLSLKFFSDEELVGVTISRVHELANFGTVSQIVHVHASRHDVIDWAISSYRPPPHRTGRRCRHVPCVLSDNTRGFVEAWLLELEAEPCLLVAGRQAAAFRIAPFLEASG